MLVNNGKFRLGITELLMLAAGIVFLAGTRSWFSVCPVMSENVMSCHWAGEALKAFSVLSVCAAVVHIAVPDQKIKIGMDIMIAGICLVSIFIPGAIISICGSADMACRHMTRPWTICISAAMLIIAAADIILFASNIAGDKHHRKIN